MNSETESKKDQTVVKEGQEATRKVFWWVLAIIALMLLTSGVAYLVDIL